MGINQGAFSGGGGGGGGAPGPQGPTGPQGPQGDPGTNGQGVPSGGTAGQYVRKTSIIDYATAWADASTVRTDLGLGTAALVNTGTSLGTVPVLEVGGALPAIPGSNLTGITSSQVSGLGTASALSASAVAQTANNLSDLANAGTARSNLGLGTAATQASSAFQAADATLTALAGVTTGADLAPYFTGTDAAGTYTLTAFGRSLMDDADASAGRTTLGLGTAATANTGTGSGNIPVLDGSARLPAVDGSQLTGITSTQVSGLGTAATLTAGTSANNVPQLDASALLPSGVIWAPETWTNRWRASDGDPTSNGFSQVGTQNLTIASTTQAGVACYSLTPPVASGTAYIQAAWTAATASWEMYAKVWIPDSATGSTQRMCISYSPATTASGSKRIEIAFSATACLIFGGTNLAALVTCPDFTDQWVDLLVQCYQSADGAANSWWRISIGRLVIYSGPPPGTLAGTAGAGAGTFYIGRISASAQVTPFYIAELAIRTALNAAPPEYRFGASTWPL